jgi:hypothetical protein
MNWLLKLLTALLAIIFLSACTPSDAQKSSVLKLPEDDLQSALDRANGETAFRDADIAFSVRGAKVAEIINSINSIPEARRQVRIGVLREHKKLVDKPDHYVELFDLPQNQAVGGIRQVSANWLPEGAMVIDAVLGVAGAAKIHGHYRPANVGGRIGVNVGAMTTLRGRLMFEPDPKELFAVSFKLDPTEISYSIASSIKDSKEVCWRVEYPCVGTWRDPIRKCEGRDCKPLWSYDIPISISDKVKISGDLVKLPVQIGIPKEFFVNSKIGETEFKRSVAIEVLPTGFASNERGVFVKAKISVKQNADTPASEVKKP